MTAPQNAIHEIPDSDPLARIHPSLREQLLGVDLEQLTPEMLKRVFSDDPETTLRDLVRDSRAKGLMP